MRLYLEDIAAAVVHLATRCWYWEHKKLEKPESSRRGIEGCPDNALSRMDRSHSQEVPVVLKSPCFCGHEKRFLPTMGGQPGAFLSLPLQCILLSFASKAANVYTLLHAQQKPAGSVRLGVLRVAVSTPKYPPGLLVFSMINIPFRGSTHVWSSIQRPNQTALPQRASLRAHAGIASPSTESASPERPMQQQLRWMM